MPIKDTPPVTMRRATNHDREAVLELHFAGLDQHGARSENTLLDRDLDDIESHYLKDGGDFIVGELDGQIICMGAIRRVDGCTAELKRMRVSRSYQNRGLGRLVLHRLLAEVKAKGYTLVTLDTSDKQAPARALYKSEGFVMTHEADTDGIHKLFFSKDIGEALPERENEPRTEIGSGRPKNGL